MGVAGMLVGPGVVMFFTSGVFAVYCSLFQLLAVLKYPDVSSFLLSTVACLLSAVTCAFLFQSQDTIIVTLVMFIVYLLPVTCMIFLIRWVIYSRKEVEANL